MPNGKLSPEQTAKILQPLLQARDLRPQMPEIYDTIANVWLLSSAKPTADDLKVLEDTARFFPRATTILVKAARIHLEAGSLDRARAIAAFGVQTARDPALKAELESIVAKLPPPPAKK